jgi:hypothetical protein
VAVGALNVGEREQGQPPATLEELLAMRIAAEAVRIVEERIREMFETTEFDADEVHGFMGSEEAAEFLGLPYSSFREIAPNLPRHAITAARFGYLQRELLAWGRERLVRQLERLGHKVVLEPLVQSA